MAWDKHWLQIRTDVAAIAAALASVITTGKLQIDLPSEAATQTTLAAVLAKLSAENTIGKVGLDQTTQGTMNHVTAGSQLVRTKIQFTGIGSYSAGDALGSIVEIPNWASVAGRGGILRAVRICAAKKSITPSLRLHFFRASNPTVSADNAAWQDKFADDDKRAGYIDMGPLSTAQDTSNSDCSRVLHTTDGSPLGMPMVADASTSLWCIPEVISPGSTAFDNSPGNLIDVILIWERM